MARAGPGWCSMLMTMEQCQEQMMIPVKREETKVEDGDGWSHPIIRVSRREEMASRQLATRIGRDGLEDGLEEGLEDGLEDRLEGELEDGLEEGLEHRLEVSRRSKREEMPSRQLATRIGRDALEGRRRSRREEMSSRQTATRIGKRGIPGLDHDWKTRIGRRAPNSIVLPVFFFRIARRT